MTTEFVILHATVSDAEELAKTLRPREAKEILEVTGMQPAEALRRDVEESEISYVALIDGQVAAMWGVVPAVSIRGAGVVWMHTGTQASRNPRAILKNAGAELAKLLRKFPLLINRIRSSSEVSLRWARWLGFNLESSGNVVNIHIRRA